jgi:hypothetical protein
VTRRDIASPGGAGAHLPDAVGALRLALAAAEAEYGGDNPTTVELRRRLTGVLITFGRDAEAAGLEVGTLRAVTDGEVGPHDRR